ncbi:MAG TPA: hypothetical protein DHV25_02035 [Candidatus Kerfeldbacteria bacterium]|nr:hypothetical protein [Candidatus Kerfeldbacteria bacterium]
MAMLRMLRKHYWAISIVALVVGVIMLLTVVKGAGVVIFVITVTLMTGGTIGSLFGLLNYCDDRVDRGGPEIFNAIPGILLGLLIFAAIILHSIPKWQSQCGESTARTEMKCPPTGSR